MFTLQVALFYIRDSSPYFKQFSKCFLPSIFFKKCVILYLTNIYSSKVNKIELTLGATVNLIVLTLLE